MADKDCENRIFVGGLSWDVTERQLENAFDRFGKIVECQVMLERDTGRPRGFGFITFADRRGMQDAIRDMHGRELGDRVISVNQAQPKLATTESPLGHGGYGGYSAGGRGGYGGGGDKPVGPDDCFKCGRPGHWARDCPSGGGGGGGRRGARPFSPPHSNYDRYVDSRDRYMDDRYDRGRNGGDRDRYDSRDDRDRYVGRDRFVSDRYALGGGERFPVDRYGASERYPPTVYGKDRGYDRDGGAPRGGGERFGERYGGGSGPGRYEGRSYRDRPGPYDRPRRGGRPPSLDRY